MKVKVKKNGTSAIRLEMLIPYRWFFSRFFSTQEHTFTYAAPAFNLYNKQLQQFNVCWNNVLRKIFVFKRWESVKCSINGISRFDFVHQFFSYKFKFLKNWMSCCKWTLKNICTPVGDLADTSDGRQYTPSSHSTRSEIIAHILTRLSTPNG